MLVQNRPIWIIRKDSDTVEENKGNQKSHWWFHRRQSTF